MSRVVPTHNLLTQLTAEGETVQFRTNGAGTFDAALNHHDFTGLPTHNLLTSCSTMDECGWIVYYNKNDALRLLMKGIHT